jgi:hypothetical protein
MNYVAGPNTVTPTPPVERRVSDGVSLVQNTDTVPTGTNLKVPSASPTGAPPEAPIVAVNTVHWYKDQVLLTTLGGAVLALEPVIEDALRSQTFAWRSFTLGCILALAAYFRQKFNTVTK